MQGTLVKCLAERSVLRQFASGNGVYLPPSQLWRTRASCRPLFTPCTVKLLGAGGCGGGSTYNPRLCPPPPRGKSQTQMSFVSRCGQ